MTISISISRNPHTPFYFPEVWVWLNLGLKSGRLGWGGQAQGRRLGGVTGQRRCSWHVCGRESNLEKLLQYGITVTIVLIGLKCMQHNDSLYGGHIHGRRLPLTVKKGGHRGSGLNNTSFHTGVNRC